MLSVKVGPHLRYTCPSLIIPIKLSSSAISLNPFRLRREPRRWPFWTHAIDDARVGGQCLYYLISRGNGEKGSFGINVIQRAARGGRFRRSTCTVFADWLNRITERNNGQYFQFIRDAQDRKRRSFPSLRQLPAVPTRYTAQVSPISFPSYCEGKSNTLFTLAPRPAFQSRAIPACRQSDNNWLF